MFSLVCVVCCPLFAVCCLLLVVCCLLLFCCSPLLVLPFGFCFLIEVLVFVVCCLESAICCLLSPLLLLSLFFVVAVGVVACSVLFVGCVCLLLVVLVVLVVLLSWVSSCLSFAVCNLFVHWLLVAV